MTKELSHTERAVIEHMRKGKSVDKVASELGIQDALVRKVWEHNKSFQDQMDRSLSITCRNI